MNVSKSKARKATRKATKPTKLHWIESSANGYAEVWPTIKDTSGATAGCASCGRNLTPATTSTARYYLYDMTKETYIPAVGVAIGSKVVILPHMPFFSNDGTALVFFKNSNAKKAKSLRTIPTKKK